MRLHKKEAYVSVYEINDEEIHKLNILRFSVPDAEWLRFVVKNRSGQADDGNWDIIAGPVANDQTSPVIELYLDGMYDEEEAIRRLLPQKLKDQFTFKTERAIALLQFREVLLQ